MSSTSETRDSVYYEFSDLDSLTDSTPRPIPDAILRHVLSQQPLDEQALLRGRAQLDRLFAAGREQERVCRERGDLLGLSCCLGNLGLILKVQGDPQGALDLHREEADLCRRVGYTRGLISALLREASLLAEHLKDVVAGLAVAEEAHRLATQPTPTPWAAETAAALEALRRHRNGT
jgi:hypothetical protein